MYSILAGLMIALGAYLNLTIGGTLGAIAFSIGLLTILAFNLHLFTGKAGGLSTKSIEKDELLCIWCGNFIGCALGAVLTLCTPNWMALSQRAAAIIQNKVSNYPLENLVLGIFCGLLMYIAVEGYKTTKSVVYVIMPVSAFILAGFNHCVADMYYLSIGASKISDLLCLIPTTIGNIIGCNIIPLLSHFHDA